MNAQPGARRRLSLLWDPRVLVGLAITVGALWFALRDISFSEVAEAIARANLVIFLVPAILANIWSIYIRALRWRYLTAGVAEIETSQLFRATAVGFMANNIFPLRMGELVRAWYLARETAASTPALLGTLILERLIDVLIVLALAATVLGAQGARASGLDPLAVVLPVGVVVTSVVGFIVALRLAPDRATGLALRITARLLPERFQERLERLLSQVVAGLGGLRGGAAFFWVGFHSAVLWLICLVIPYILALYSLGIDLGGTWANIHGGFIILVWVGAAVALPSAPGFLGPFHAACWVALRPFGVPKEMALALGTLTHAVFWVSLTALGLAVLRVRGGSLDQALVTGPADPSDSASPSK